MPNNFSLGSRGDGGGRVSQPVPSGGGAPVNQPYYGGRMPVAPTGGGMYPGGGARAGSDGRASMPALVGQTYPWMGANRGVEIGGRYSGGALAALGGDWAVNQPYYGGNFGPAPQVPGGVASYYPAQGNVVGAVGGGRYNPIAAAPIGGLSGVPVNQPAFLGAPVNQPAPYGGPIPTAPVTGYGVPVYQPGLYPTAPAAGAPGRILGGAGGTRVAQPSAMVPTARAPVGYGVPVNPPAYAGPSGGGVAPYSPAGGFFI